MIARPGSHGDPDYLVELVRRERIGTAVLAPLLRAFAEHPAAATCTSLRRVINATGVVIHTNLGRAPLGRAARAWSFFSRRILSASVACLSAARACATASPSVHAAVPCRCDAGTRMWNSYGSRTWRATTAANNRLVGNYVHDVMQQMNDGGCIYTLSANPGSMISDNYCLRNEPGKGFGYRPTGASSVAGKRSCSACGRSQ